MASRTPPQPPLPAKGETPQTCRRCELWELATQAVPGEGQACSVWLLAEIDALAPRVIVALGATALRALTGASPPIVQVRGKSLTHRNSIGQASRAAK